MRNMFINYFHIYKLHALTIATITIYIIPQQYIAIQLVLCTHIYVCMCIYTSYYYEYILYSIYIHTTMYTMQACMYTTHHYNKHVIIT